MIPDLTISEVQHLAMTQFDDPQVVRVVFGGGAAGGKSFLIGLLCAMACKKYPGTRWALARKELKSLKQTTLATLISKVHRVLGIGESDYKLNLLDSTLEYTNGSSILLLDLTAKPSDPEMESLGSLELTGAFVDEIGEVNKKSFDILASRVNRWLNKEYGLTGKIVGSTNPSPGFVRQEFFDKYEALGGGRIQRWKNGHVFVNGVRVDAYDVYIKSTAIDNPFIDDNYVEGLRRLPPQERKRLLDGDWNYLDEDNSLFTMAIIDKMTVYKVPDETEKFNKYIGVDPSDAGKDSTIVTLVEGGVITQQLEIKSPTIKDSAIGFHIAGKLISFAEKHGFTKPIAKHITIEGNGVGASLRDALRTLGWNVNVYTATLQTRNEGFYQFMLDADSGAIKMLNTIVEDGTLLRQLAAHRFDLDSGKPVITRKKDLRQILGRSPDHADSAMIANMAANKFKPKNISAYIRW
jgi:phage terminase large subunit